jgi:hypothetical protein
MEEYGEDEIGHEEIDQRGNTEGRWHDTSDRE